MSSNVLLLSKLEEFGNVNSHKAVTYLNKKIGKERLTEEDVSDLFANKDILYFCEKNGKPILTNSEGQAKYKMVKISISDCSNEDYFMFIKKNFIWQGVAFGSKDYLLGRIQSPTVLDYCTNDFLKDFYDSLFDKEKWRTIKNDNLDYSRLKYYLIRLSVIAKKKLRNSLDSSEVITNSKGDRTIYKSNLMDTYGNRIILCHTIRCFKSQSGNEFRLVNPTIIKNQKDFWENGFTSVQYDRLKPLEFYVEPTDIIFNGG